MPLRAGVALLACLACLVVFPRAASAQLHWDASLQAGVMKRVLVERPPGSDGAGFGPVAQLTGHVALLPLVHVGGYFGHDISPLPGNAASRQITWGGLRAKATIPLQGDVRAYAFLGFGMVGATAPSYETSLPLSTAGGPPVRHDVTVESAGGHFFEVPFGVGASYKLFKPWHLVAELTGRAGFAHSGSVYEDPGPQVKVSGLPDQNALPSGLDRFAVGLTVGVMVDL